MTSKIVVNNIEADTGVSTVTFGSEISASTFTGNVTGNVTGNLTGTASTATAATTAYGLSGSPTLSGITSVSTTNLTVNGNAYPSTGPLSNRNLIINGAMQVAQRGTSSTTSNYGTVDRFACYFGGGAQTQTQETLTSGDPYNEGFRYFLRIANTTASTGAGDSRQIMAKLEAQSIAQSGWNYTSSTSYVTVSFWVRASVSQEYYGYFHTRDSTEQIYPFSLGTLSANTWTKVTKTFPGNSNITINNDNGEGLRLVLSPFWGTDYTDSGVSLDTWAAYASGTRTPDYTNTWAGTTDATFDITGVQLEVGSVATPFEHRSYGQELSLCQRYYGKIRLRNQEWIYNEGNGADNKWHWANIPFTMRANPSVDVSDLTTGGSVSGLSGTISAFAAQSPGDTPGRISTRVTMSTATGTARNVYHTDALSNDYIAVSAEL
jgi:hypothetical protein